MDEIIEPCRHQCTLNFVESNNSCICGKLHHRMIFERPTHRYNDIPEQLQNEEYNYILTYSSFLIRL
jgi:hypothetical protein